MNTTLKDFENSLLKSLTNPNPTPEFTLWQPVVWELDRLDQEPKRIETRIVGLYYVSAAVAFREGSDPGWYYYVEGKFENRIFHEDDLEPIEQKETPACAGA